jgi:hypothetical protein
MSSRRLGFRDQGVNLKIVRKHKRFKEEKLDESRDCLIGANI